MRKLRTSLKWLYPGMRVKRWVALGLAGLLAFLVGMGIIIQVRPEGSRTLALRVADWIIAQAPADIRPGTLGLLLALLGGALCLIAFGKLIASLTGVLDPDKTRGGLAETIYQQRRLSQGKRIVVIGGGTGLSTLLRGLKQHTDNITAVVTVADDGGSSGKIQKQLNILPPGDLRNCLVALADAEPQMMELFQFRFRNTAPAPVNAVVAAPAPVPSSVPAGISSETAAGSVALAPSSPPAGGGYAEGLRDHAFGNLLIAAMCAIYGGDFERAIRETARVLNIRGRVYPSTVSPIRLIGEMEDGSRIEGETSIAASPLKIKRIALDPPEVCPIDDVLEAIERADAIILGPGSVFTSIIPNLLVRGIPEAIRRSRAKKFYACNVMTQPGETDGFSAYDHVRAIESHAHARAFDYVLVNTGRPSPELLEKYRKAGAMLVEPDTDRIKAAGYRPITGNFINQTDVVRHDASRLTDAVIRLIT